MRKYHDESPGQLKKVAGLFKRANRLKFAQAVIEGPQAVRESLRCMPELVRDVYVTERGLAQHRDLDHLLAEVDPYTHVLSDEVFARLSTNAQGFLAVISIPDEEDLAQLLASSTLLVGAIELSDPGNLGTIIRCADAAGADAVILGRGSVEATNPKVIRSTAGSYFHVPVIEDEDMADVVARAKAAGMQVLVADGGGSVSLTDLSDRATGTVGDGIDLRKPTMWLLGNEAHGFTDGQRAWADAIVSVPMWGSAESLNVAMATTLCLYASAVAQHRG